MLADLESAMLFPGQRQQLLADHHIRYTGWGAHKLKDQEFTKLLETFRINLDKQIRIPNVKYNDDRKNTMKAESEKLQMIMTICASIVEYHKLLINLVQQIHEQSGMKIVGRQLFKDLAQNTELSISMSSGSSTTPTSTIPAG